MPCVVCQYKGSLQLPFKFLGMRRCPSNQPCLSLLTTCVLGFETLCRVRFFFSSRDCFRNTCAARGEVRCAHRCLFWQGRKKGEICQQCAHEKSRACESSEKEGVFLLCIPFKVAVTLSSIEHAVIKQGNWATDTQDECKANCTADIKECDCFWKQAYAVWLLFPYQTETRITRETLYAASSAYIAQFFFSRNQCFLITKVEKVKEASQNPADFLGFFSGVVRWNACSSQQQPLAC